MGEKDLKRVIQKWCPDGKFAQYNFFNNPMGLNKPGYIRWSNALRNVCQSCGLGNDVFHRLIVLLHEGHDRGASGHC